MFIKLKIPPIIISCAPSFTDVKYRNLLLALFSGKSFNCRLMVYDLHSHAIYINGIHTIL